MSTQGQLCTPPFVAGQRPKESDPDVIQAAARALAERLRSEFSAEDFPSPDTETELAGVIGRQHDGYDIAKHLERSHGWNIDAATVEILDEADYAISSAQRQMEARWVELAKPTPSLAIGARVRHRIRWEDHDVEVTAIDAKQGKYTVLVEALGHVREGVGTHGFIVNWEEVEGKDG